MTFGNFRCEQKYLTQEKMTLVLFRNIVCGSSIETGPGVDTVSKIYFIYAFMV